MRILNRIGPRYNLRRSDCFFACVGKRVSALISLSLVQMDVNVIGEIHIFILVLFIGPMSDHLTCIIPFIWYDCVRNTLVCTNYERHLFFVIRKSLSSIWLIGTTVTSATSRYHVNYMWLVVCSMYLRRRSAVFDKRFGL